MTDKPTPLTAEERLADWLMDHIPQVNRWMTTGWRDTMRDEGVVLARQMLAAARTSAPAGLREALIADVLRALATGQRWRWWSGDGPVSGTSVEFAAALSAALAADPVPSLDVANVRVWGADPDAIRYALAYTDAHDPGWRARLTTPASDPGGE
jgi:hypothetical protein